ncbi:MAG: cytochrome c biogenesis protein CcdA [Pseudomonadota bacterium]
MNMRLTMWARDLALAAYGGLDAWFSSCALPLLLGYAAIIIGASLAVRLNPSPTKQRPPDGAGVVFAFWVGFAVIFFILGLPTTKAGLRLWELQPTIRRVGGVALVVIGFVLAGAAPKSWAAWIRSRDPQVRGSLLVLTFILGAAFGAGWSPCPVEILMSITVFGSTPGYLWDGSMLLSAFIIGLSLPLLLTGLALYLFTQVVSSRSKLVRVMVRGSGWVLAGLGILLFFGRLSLIAP